MVGIFMIDVLFFLIFVCFWVIIDLILCEGEQFVCGNFGMDDKVEIVWVFDVFGVEYIEVIMLMVSEQIWQDICKLIGLGLWVKFLIYVCCYMEDVQWVVDIGVDGFDLLFGISSFLCEFLYGKSIVQIIDMVGEVIGWIKIYYFEFEICFFVEDIFCLEEVDLMVVYSVVFEFGVYWVGLVDMVGVVIFWQVYMLVCEVCKVIYEGCGIEFYGYNDIGCVVSNVYEVIEVGVIYIDMIIFGIGECNGIMLFGGLFVCMFIFDL